MGRLNEGTASIMASERKTLPDGNNSPQRGGGFLNLLARIAAALVAVAVLVVGIVLFGWMWWRLRRAMRQARDDPRFRNFADYARQGQPPPRADIIEGEVIRGETQDDDEGHR